ncbi:M67 family metallopeptidase [Chitinispirillales bacterium ANBcel5]|uniref:M67 family metallopeptidase n=1 Tax=Cellulosispirillum alkaliphilum TaxID=3039283 RepID=UPI002A58F7AE|nr:M67 family metallopeptidase [Chitinispirillales bacterium ANBcel5]
MLTIEPSVYDSLIEHSRKDAPVEACGYLAEKNGIVTLAFPLTNTDASSEHYSLDPKEQFETVRHIRSKGMKLRAVYHSHPQTPARPSQEDIRLAYDPNLSYVIVSLADKAPVIKSFIIVKGDVKTEEIEIVPDTVNE